MDKNEEDRIFNGSLNDYDWKNEVGESITPAEVSKYLNQRVQNTKQEAMQKYVALGTVVKLKNMTGSYMVIGFRQNDQNNQENDYVACEYPYGVTEGRTILFNHEQIERFYHLGMVDDAERAFKKSISDVKKI